MTSALAHRTNADMDYKDHEERPCMVETHVIHSLYTVTVLIVSLTFRLSRQSLIHTVNALPMILALQQKGALVAPNQ